MGVVVQLEPLLAAKEIVAANIRALIKNGGIGRHYATQQVCRAILENHCIKEMDFGKYTVRLAPGGIGIKFIPRKYSALGTCPECGGDQGRFLGVKEEGLNSDKVVWGCVNCLEIFWTYEDNS